MSAPAIGFHVITLFPEMILTSAKIGLVGQAIDKGRIGLQALNPRDFKTDVHQSVDDRPFGGGDGMVMLAEPLRQALEKIQGALNPSLRSRVIHLSPRGRPLTDALAREIASYDDVILISSRYGGLDQRFINSCVDEEISIGDYILTGGELAALVVIDAVARLVPGVLGNEFSNVNESFAEGRGLEHPQFTRPREWEGQAVPAGYLSGDHAKIARLQRVLSLLTTLERRPDLLPADLLSNPSYSDVLKASFIVLKELSDEDLKTYGLRSTRAQFEEALAPEGAG